MCADDGISFVSYLGGAVKYIKGNEYLKFHIVIIPFFLQIKNDLYIYRLRYPV